MLALPVVAGVRQHPNTVVMAFMTIWPVVESTTVRGAGEY